MGNKNILCVKGIKKSFGGVHALKGVDLTIAHGETHCLAGENGCGKSTIIKIISGFYKADAGTIEIDGKEFKNASPAACINAGVQVIYQDFSIFPNLTVMENLAFNQTLASKKKFVNKKEFRRIAETAVNKINFKVDLDAKVETLPVADKQLIAISRALLDDAKLIIMDEPTTALTKNEVERLFEIIADLKKNGVAILFVSHKLDEVFEISDHITVLRSGENVVSMPVAEMTEEKFAYYMTGRNFETNKVKEIRDNIDNTVVLEVEHLAAEGFEDVSFQLKKGEILGITGQLGSGRTELSLALFGMLKPSHGIIKIDGNPVEITNVNKAQALGLALVPEDRLTEGLFLPRSIINNITTTSLAKLASKLGLLQDKKVVDESAHWVEKMGVATKNHEFPVQTLSGGNQQKVVLGRWIANNPKVLILNGPTVGVDIGAKYDIHALLDQLAKEGMSIIIVSDDVAEVMATCDRVMVMQAGRITKTLEADQMNTVAIETATR